MRELAATGLLLAIVLLFLAPALLPGRVFMPLDIVTQGWPPWQQPNQPVEVENWLLTDVVNYIFPVKQFMAESVQDGTLPLWNPYVLTGYPFTYNTQAGLFYPLSLLYYLLPWYAAVDGTIVLQMLLGALFMYAFLRRLRLHRLAAVAGGALFACNGLMMVWLEWQVVHAAIIWLPLQLLLLESMVAEAESPEGKTEKALIYGLLAAIAFAIPWLGGHWNWTLYTSMTLAAYGLWRLWPAFRRSAGRRRFGLLGLFLLPFTAGVALALVQVWPAFNFLSQTHRRPLPFRDSLLSGLWDRAVVSIVPNFFGNPSHGNNWWGIDNYNEVTFYLGILPLLLIGLVLFLRRDRITLFFAGWGLLGLLWALGTPAYGLLYVLPAFSGLYPGRAAIIVVICGAVLAALAFDRLLSPGPLDKARLSRVIAGVVALLLLVLTGYVVAYRDDVVRTAGYLLPYLGWALLMLALSAGLLLGRTRGPLSSKWFGWLALALIVVDLYLMSYGYNTVSSVAGFYPASPVVDFLQADSVPFRIATPAEGIVFYPNSSLMARISNASGYEPGLPRRHVDYYNAAEGESAIRFNRILMPLRGLDSPLFDLLNVKYITTINDWWQGDSSLAVSQDLQQSWLPLSSGEEVEQSFHMNDAGLQRVDLYLRGEGVSNGLITARVLTGDGGQELAHDQLPASSLSSEGGWHSFLFGAFPSEWGRDFQLAVSYKGDGRIELGSAGGDHYPDGALRQSDAEAGDDLAFRLYYLPRPELAFEAGKTRVYVNEGYQPRAFAVHRAIEVEADEALNTVLEHAGELGEVVVLESRGDELPEVRGSAGESAVTITEYGLNEVRLQAEMAAPGFVVLADSYYPGWKATVSGEATPIYQADYLLRAVYAPEGSHEIVFTFRPPDFIVGGLISAATLALIAIALLVAIYRMRKGD